MTVDSKIRNEKLQHDINREVTKISVLLSRKKKVNSISKSYNSYLQFAWKNLAGKDIPSYDQSGIGEKAKSTHYHFRKAFEKRTKTKAIEELGEKQIKAIENGVEKQLLDMDEKLIAALFSEGFFTKKPEDDIIKIIKAEKITWYRLFNL